MVATDGFCHPTYIFNNVYSPPGKLVSFLFWVLFTFPWVLFTFLLVPLGWFHILLVLSTLGYRHRVSSHLTSCLLYLVFWLSLFIQNL